jgi:gag-polypeptide of LTR copia-type
LHRVYAAIFGARITDLRRQLQSTTCGSQSCSAYFEKMMSIADQLSVSGSPIADSDLISILLSGLGPEFNSFVVANTTRSEPISTSDLFGFALAHVALLSSQNSTVISDLSCNASSPLEVIHSDLWGPSPIVSSNGFKYYVHFLDEYSRFFWIYFLRSKDEVVNVFSL